MENLEPKLLGLISSLYMRPNEMEHYINHYIEINGCVPDELFYKEIKRHSEWFLGNGTLRNPRNEITKQSINNLCDNTIKEIRRISFVGDNNRPQLKYMTDTNHPKINLESMKPNNPILEKRTTIHAQNVIIDNKGIIGDINQSSNKSVSQVPKPQPKSALKKIIIPAIISILCTVIAGYILYKMGWV